MINLAGYRYLRRSRGVVGGDVVIKGTRLQPEQVIGYGTREEIKEDFELTDAQIDECLEYIRRMGRGRDGSWYWDKQNI